MPQINDTTGNQKTSSVLRVDAKAENWERIPIQRGSVDIIEGGIMVRGADGKAALVDIDPTNIIANLIYLNFANPNGGGAYDRQVVNDVGGTQLSVNLEGGGYVGVNGSNIRCGLPLTERFFVKADLALIAIPGTQLVLKRETDGAAERTGLIKFGAVAKGLTLGAVGANNGNLSFGTVESVDGNVVWFIHSNRGASFNA